MKNPVKILIGIAALVVVLALAKDQLIKMAIESQGAQVLGAPVRIDRMSVGFLSQSVRIIGFRVGNPPGFPGDTMLDISEIGVDYDLAGIFKGTLHLPTVILKLKEMNVVKNKDGKLNVDALKVVQNKEQAKPQPKKTSNNLPMVLDTVVLDLGKVTVTDYTKQPPSVVAHDIGVHDKTFHDVKSAQQLATLVMIEAMGPTALRNAAIYGAASVLGVAFLPVGVASMLLSKDSSTKTYSTGIDRAYEAALEVVRKRGAILSENKNNGVIKANVDGAGVTLELIRDGSRTTVKVSARKMLLPKAEIANGILHELDRTIK